MAKNDIPNRSGEEEASLIFPEYASDVPADAPDPINEGAWKIADENAKGK